MNARQVRAVLWLRWCLGRNQLARGGLLGRIVAVVVPLVILLAALGGFAGGWAVGALALPRATPLQLLLIWDVTLAFFGMLWLFSVVNDIQRSESIDLQRLLHLPVSLGGLFVLNYLVSHLSFALILTVPFMTGMAFGLAIARSLVFLLLVPALVAFILMITAWTYCLRGWLSALMVNPRRRRAIVMGLTTGVILLVQLPNLLFNVWNRKPEAATPPTARPSAPADVPVPAPRPKKKLPPAFLAAHRYVPLLWVGQSAADLARNRPWFALGSCAFGLGVAALGLRRAYLQTLRFYRGDHGSSRLTSVPVPEVPRTAPDRAGLLEWRIPWVAEESAAVALCTLRSLLRAPEIKMGLATSFAMLLLFTFMIFGRRSEPPPEAARPFLLTGAVVFAAFGLVQFFLNQFGTDREGFRALVLTGAPRHRILLGKNLACAPFILGIGAVYLGVASWILKPTLPLLLAALLQLLAAFVICCGFGNLVSILAPFRIAAGSLKPTKVPFRATLVIFVSHLSFPIAMLPVLIPPAVDLLVRVLDWPRPFPLTLPLSGVILAGCLLLYRWSLRPLGDLLLRREQQILAMVTTEVE